MPASKRDALVGAAMRVFYRNGFHASGLDLILQEAGVSRMTLYNHFKSKDELVVAAMRRRDEIFRNRLMKFVEAASDDPADRLLAVFDYHVQVFSDPEFHGCLFINAAAEFPDADAAPRRVAAEHKRELLRFFRALARDAGLHDPDHVAAQIALLIEGCIVSARVVGQVADGGHDPAAPARLAREMAERIIDDARQAGTAARAG